MADDGERVQPWQMPGLRRIRRWQSGHASHHAARHVTLAALPDGRWLAEDSDVKQGSRVHRTRSGAEQRLTELMWDGDWQEVPAAYDSAGRPLDGGWVRLGSGWVRDPRSEDAADNG